MLAERTLAFAAQAPGLQNRKALGASLMTLAETLGAARYACLYLRRDAGGLTIDRSISNLPRLWQELYLERGYDATDPVFQSAVRGGAYGYWNELTRGVTMDRASREVMATAREFDMKDGFTKRVTLDSGGIAVMMVAGRGTGPPRAGAGRAAHHVRHLRQRRRADAENRRRRGRRRERIAARPVAHSAQGAADAGGRPFEQAGGADSSAVTRRRSSVM